MNAHNNNQSTTWFERGIKAEAMLRLSSASKVLDISEAGKPAALAALYNGCVETKVRKFKDRDDMSVEEARSILMTKDKFSFINGRPIMIDFSSNLINVSKYDRYNGDGAAAAALINVGVMDYSMGPYEYGFLIGKTTYKEREELNFNRLWANKLRHMNLYSEQIDDIIKSHYDKLEQIDDDSGNLLFKGDAIRGSSDYAFNIFISFYERNEESKSIAMESAEKLKVIMEASNLEVDIKEHDKFIAINGKIPETEREFIAGWADGHELLEKKEDLF